VPGATSYTLLKQSSPGGAFVAIPAAIGISGTTFKDTSVTNGITYSYKVVAQNAGGTSDASLAVSAAPKQVPIRVAMKGRRMLRKHLAGDPDTAQWCLGTYVPMVRQIVLKPDPNDPGTMICVAPPAGVYRIGVECPLCASGRGVRQRTRPSRWPTATMNESVF